LTPEIHILTSGRTNDTTLQHHILQGLWLSYLLLFYLVVVVIGFCLEGLLGIQLSIHSPDTAMQLNSWLADLGLMDLDVLVAAAPLIFWACLWTVGFVRACRDSAIPIPLFDKVAAGKTARTAAVVGSFALQFLCVAGITVALRGSFLARPEAGPASVYMLYEEDINIPRWVYAAGLYPVAEAATARWGAGSVVVQPLTRASIGDAIHHGRMVILATHGGNPPGTIPLSGSDEHYAASDVDQGGGAGSNLQLIYMAGCFTGSMEQEWKRSLAPAEVISFNRFSWVFEHVMWLWFRGPILVSKMR
jgi:hypothetical protein